MGMVQPLYIGVLAFCGSRGFWEALCFCAQLDSAKKPAQQTRPRGFGVWVGGWVEVGWMVNPSLVSYFPQSPL